MLFSSRRIELTLLVWADTLLWENVITHANIEKSKGIVISTFRLNRDIVLFLTVMTFSTTRLWSVRNLIKMKCNFIINSTLGENVITQINVNLNKIFFSLKSVGEYVVELQCNGYDNFQSSLESVHNLILWQQSLILFSDWLGRFFISFQTFSQSYDIFL